MVKIGLYTLLGAWVDRGVSGNKNPDYAYKFAGIRTFSYLCTRDWWSVFCAGTADKKMYDSCISGCEFSTLFSITDFYLRIAN